MASSGPGDRWADGLQKAASAVLMYLNVEPAAILRFNRSNGAVNRYKVGDGG